MKRFVEASRLGSPDHYRYYFAFSHPAGSVPDEEIQAFATLAERHPDQAVQRFAALAQEQRPQGGTKAEALTDRLATLADRISERTIPGIFASFAFTMDEIAANTRPGDFGEHSAWLRATRAVYSLLPRTTGEIRAESLQALFQHGQSTGWLTAILRGEIFAHGLYGDRQQPEEKWLLTREEFDSVLAMMLQRYRATPANQLMGVPHFLSVLYAWRQAGYGDEVKEWVQAQTATDTGLLDFLASVRSWSGSSTFGVQYPLKRRDLEPFLNFDEAITRLRALSTNKDITEADRHRAQVLSDAANMGDELDH